MEKKGWVDAQGRKVRQSEITEITPDHPDHRRLRSRAWDRADPEVGPAGPRAGRRAPRRPPPSHPAPFPLPRLHAQARRQHGVHARI
jgi:hypothetical protein